MTESSLLSTIKGCKFSCPFNSCSNRGKSFQLCPVCSKLHGPPNAISDGYLGDIPNVGLLISYFREREVKNSVSVRSGLNSLRQRVKNSLLDVQRCLGLGWIGVCEVLHYSELDMDYLVDLWQDLNSFLLRLAQFLPQIGKYHHVLGESSVLPPFLFIILRVPEQSSASMYNDALDDLACSASTMKGLLDVSSSVQSELECRSVRG